MTTQTVFPLHSKTITTHWSCKRSVGCIPAKKAQIPNTWGKGIRRCIQSTTPLPANWKQFLRNDGKKSELFPFLSDQPVKIETEKLVVATKGLEL